MAIDQPAQLLADLEALRTDTRNARHAYWLPVGTFGLLLAAAAPLYVQPLVLCNGNASCSYSVSTGVDARWLVGLGGGVAGVYWLCALIVGAVITAGWYAWYGRVTGLTTRVRGPVAAWTIGLLAAMTAVFYVGASLFFYVVPGRGFVPMFVVGVGLFALSVLERSRLLAVVSILVCGWAVLVSLYNVENVLYRLLSAFGVSDQAMPFSTATTVDVLVPGALLLATAGGAFWADLRRR